MCLTRWSVATEQPGVGCVLLGRYCCCCSLSSRKSWMLATFQLSMRTVSEGLSGGGGEEGRGTLCKYGPGLTYRKALCVA